MNCSCQACASSHIPTRRPHLPQVPVAVKDHEGPLENKFPIENRLLPQGVWLGLASVSRLLGGMPRAEDQAPTEWRLLPRGKRCRVQRCTELRLL